MKPPEPRDWLDPSMKQDIAQWEREKERQADNAFTQSQEDNPDPAPVPKPHAKYEPPEWLLELTNWAKSRTKK